MKKYPLVIALFTSISFTAHAQLAMSFEDFHNKVRVTVTENGQPVEDAQIESSLLGQKNKVTDKNGRAFFYKKNNQRVHKFTATTEEGKQAEASKFIARNR
ncbi:hypothetical protein L4D20_19635 [Vibrio kyushuensis]|uniref:hypothetical protein n=1 Tax=Vibrio kyushuensis TaxID=2910249 RepID=UPI003D141FFA